MQYAVSNERIERTLFGDIHSTAEFIFQIGKQPPGEPWWRARTGLNQQVDVAVRPCLAPREGPEHTHVPNAVPGGNGEDGGALVLAQLIKGHAPPFSHPGQDRGISIAKAHASPGIPGGRRALSANAYWYMGMPAAPTKLPKTLGTVDPFDFSVGEKVAE